MNVAPSAMIRRARRLLISAVATAAVPSNAPAGTFYMGADVSLIPFIESRGGTFRDAGQVLPAERIMVNNGANLFRLRLFVNPDPDYSNTAGAIQDLNYTIALARRLKQSGADILLDFHYSDTWADPGNQDKPAAWSSQNFVALNATVRNYTRDALIAFRNAGVMPEIVQVGNEITNGMLWPSGQVIYSGSQQSQNQSWMNFGSLLNSAIQGVRDVDLQSPGTRTNVVVHIDGGNVDGRAQYYYNQITHVGGVSDYETFAMSFYPTSSSALSNLQENLEWIANHTEKDVLLAEFNYRWKGGATGAPWASTSAGQRDALVAVRDLVRSLPDDRGRGVVWWYPESIPVPGTFIWQNGAVALFDDSGGDALPALDQFHFPAPTWNAGAAGAWSEAANWTGGIPNGAGASVRFGPSMMTGRAIIVDIPRSVGTMTFMSAQAYTVTGPATLSLDGAANEPARIDVLDGSHTIDSPIELAGDATINVAWTGGLAISSPIDALGRKLVKTGSGTLELRQVRVSALDVRFGTLRIGQEGITRSEEDISVVSTLSIGAMARLDLMNHALIVDYSDASPADDVRRWIAQGRLLSGSAGGIMRLGYAEAVEMDRAALAGYELDDTSLLVTLTRGGDANLDGKTDAADLAALARGWQSAGHWTAGDFDYSGFVDIADLMLLAAGWTAGDEALEESLAALGLPASSVPEPAGCFGFVTAGALLRRRCRIFKG